MFLLSRRAASGLSLGTIIVLSACSGGGSPPSTLPVAAQSNSTIGGHTMNATAPTIQRPLSDFLNAQGSVGLELAWLGPKALSGCPTLGDVPLGR